MPDEPGSERSSQLLVLGKIAQILDAFTFSHPWMTRAQLQRSTGLPTSTIQRLVASLVQQGFLDAADEKLRIGARMAYWAATATRDLDLLSVVNPVLKEIRDETGETTCFFRVEQGFRVCVAVAETAHALRRDMYVGKVIPLHVGSAGRVLVAFDGELTERVLDGPRPALTDATVTDSESMRKLLQQTRIDGFAITNGERETGASGLSAPVFDPATDILGALTISGPTFRLPPERCAALVDLLVSRAEQLTRTLGGRHPRGS